MKFFSTVALAVSLVAAAPAPVQKRAANITDTQILNYALTLEHLENAFYSGALAKFDEGAFESAGFPDWVRGRFSQIGEHEAAHVAFLSNALGAQATQACNYSFPYTDPKSFAALSAILEGVGVSAYLGAAASITNKDYLTAAAAVLTTESRHQAWVNSAVQKGAPWSGALDTPLDFNQVFSLAAPFITSCPASNPALPVKAFPGLTVSGSMTPGGTITLAYDGAQDGDELALFSGLAPQFVKISNKQATLPSSLQGTVYAVVTKTANAVNDDSTVAGPAILVFPFNSKVGNP